MTRTMRIKNKVEAAGITVTSVAMSSFETDSSIECGHWDIQLCKYDNIYCLLDTRTYTYYDDIGLKKCIEIIKKAA